MIKAQPPRQDYRLCDSDLADFKATVLIENLRRFFALIILSLALNILTIILEWQAIGRFDTITNIRLAMLVIGILYLALTGRPGGRPYRLQRVLFLGITGFGILLIAMISAQVLFAMGNTFIFIISIMLVSTLLYLSIPEFLGVMAPGVLYLGVAVFKVIQGGFSVGLMGNVVNMITVTAFGVLAAHLSYKSRKQRFTYELYIRRYNEYLETLAGVDGLTGVANRRKIDETAASVQAFACREKIVVSVLMLDLDNFKGFNDTFGHLAGDELLKKTAAALQDVLHRHSDLFGRYGGEEFIAILPGTDADGAALAGEKMRAAVYALAEPHPAVPFGVVTVSVGYASGVPGSELDIQDIVRRADEALYRAKRLGKNRVEG